MVQPLPVPMEGAGLLHETSSLLLAYSFFFYKSIPLKNR